jgi:hypothetical protein
VARFFFVGCRAWLYHTFLNRRVLRTEEMGWDVSYNTVHGWLVGCMCVCTVHVQIGFGVSQ